MIPENCMKLPRAVRRAQTIWYTARMLKLHPTFVYVVGFLVLTVALLVPSAGLTTLPIPDGGPAPSLVFLADHPHVGKKIGASVMRIIAGNPALQSAFPAIFLVLAICLLLGSAAYVIFVWQNVQIRAPPRIARVPLFI